MATTSIHNFYDGSKMRRIGARELKEIPIWKGNRILDGRAITVAFIRALGRLYSGSIFGVLVLVLDFVSRL